MIITRQNLIAIEACDQARYWFIDQYGDGGAPILQAMTDCPEPDWVVWGVSRLRRTDLLYRLLGVIVRQAFTVLPDWETALQHYLPPADEPINPASAATLLQGLRTLLNVQYGSDWMGRCYTGDDKVLNLAGDLRHCLWSVLQYEKRQDSSLFALAAFGIPLVKHAQHLPTAVPAWEYYRGLLIEWVGELERADKLQPAFPFESYPRKD